MIITNDIEKNVLSSLGNAEKFAIFSEKLKVKDSKLGVRTGYGKHQNWPWPLIIF